MERCRCVPDPKHGILRGLLRERMVMGGIDTKNVSGTVNTACDK